MAVTKDVVESAIRCWNAGDREGWLAFAAPDILVDEGQGRPAWAALYDTWAGAFPDRQIEPQQTVEEGEFCAVVARLAGTHTGTLRLGSIPEAAEIPPTGRRVAATYVAINRVVEGKIAAAEHYWDRMELFRQLGLMPGVAPGATA